MSSLTQMERSYLEKLFGMKTGYVLDYSDATFGDFFDHFNIDIHGQKFATNGTSKANKMRSFWTQESDELVGSVLSEMLDLYKTNCEINDEKMNSALFQKTSSIVSRLSNKVADNPKGKEVDDFLTHEFTIPSIKNLPIEESLAPIIQSRLDEALTAIRAGAHLSVIFLCGSVLEAILLGAAQKEPARFNQSPSCPRTDDGKPKRFHEWYLSQLIDVACEIGILKPDVKKFSHGLRDFRNYIHPYQQMVSGFTPDEHTAKVCFQVLKAALASVAGERK